MVWNTYAYGTILGNPFIFTNKFPFFSDVFVNLKGSFVSLDLSENVMIE